MQNRECIEIICYSTSGLYAYTMNLGHQKRSLHLRSDLFPVGSTCLYSKEHSTSPFCFMQLSTDTAQGDDVAQGDVCGTPESKAARCRLVACVANDLHCR